MKQLLLASNHNTYEQQLSAELKCALEGLKKEDVKIGMSAFVARKNQYLEIANKTI